MFTLQDSILGNIGWAWNFFGMMCCKNMRVIDSSLLGELPDGIFLKYTEYKLSKSYLDTHYNSTSFRENAVKAIKYHLNLDIELENIYDFKCGNNGMVVIIIDINQNIEVSLELSGKSYV